MAAPGSPEVGTPTDQILNMRTQGLSNNQITEALQRQGFNTTQIMDAMNQADVRNEVQPFPLKKGDKMVENPMNPQVPPPGAMPPPQGAPGMPPPIGGEPMQPMDTADYADDSSDQARIEELAEAIIDEKWTALVENINRIIEWKEKTESRITTIETDMKGMKASFDKLHMAILEKVGQYDQHIQDVGTEVKALEKVFQKVLPGFIENVSELSRITEKIKRSTPPAKKE